MAIARNTGSGMSKSLKGAQKDRTTYENPSTLAVDIGLCLNS